MKRTRNTQQTQQSNTIYIIEDTFFTFKRTYLPSPPLLKKWNTLVFVFSSYILVVYPPRLLFVRCSLFAPPLLIEKCVLPMRPRPHAICHCTTPFPICDGKRKYWIAWPTSRIQNKCSMWCRRPSLYLKTRPQPLTRRTPRPFLIQPSERPFRPHCR